MLLTRAKPWKEITYLETAPAVHYELTNHLGNGLSVITPDASDATQPAIERLTENLVEQYVFYKKHNLMYSVFCKKHYICEN